jgi:hypothetical protein
VTTEFEQVMTSDGRDDEMKCQWMSDLSSLMQSFGHFYAYLAIYKATNVATNIKTCIAKSLKKLKLNVKELEILHL